MAVGTFTYDTALIRMPVHAADLVQLMLGSQQPLLAKLAVDVAGAQDKRGSQTVGNRFREQLQDLITRLDECALCASAKQWECACMVE